MSPVKAVAVMVALALVRILRPIVTIRFGTLFVSRLGHLAGNTECYLCEKDAGINRPKRVWDIWCPQGKPANQQLLKMFARCITVSKFGAAVAFAGGRMEWFKQHHQFNDSQWGRDIHNLMEKSPPHLRFTKAEEKRGQEGLRALGIPEGAKWVCIIARDPMYLKVTEPGNDYDYHSFRNSNIQNYREAAVALMDKGYYVIRMGQHVEAPMKLQAPKFIDYAINPMRSEFMDVYLGAKCEFCISNGTGFDGIPMIFRRPICFVNEAPFEYLSTWMQKSLAIWKHHYRRRVEGIGRLEPLTDAEMRLTPEEIVKCGAGMFSRTEQYEQANIVLIENSPAEILEVAQEMVERLETGFGYSVAQDEFWDEFPRSKSPYNGLPLHGDIRLRIGAKFLERYGYED